MLRIDLQTLQHEPLEWEERVESPAEVFPAVDAGFAAPLEVTGRAESAGRQTVRVTGSLRTVVSMACRRCLDDVVIPLELSFDVWYRPDADEGEERAWPVEPGAGTLDLRPAIREELMLATPAYPVCASECAGLCPSCGARADSACGCEPEAGDPRWDALRALRGG